MQTFCTSHMMAWENDLNEHEKGKIIACKKCGHLDDHTLDEKLGRFHRVILKFLKLGKLFGVKKPPTQSQNLTLRLKRIAIKYIFQQEGTACQLSSQVEFRLLTTALYRAIINSRN